MADTQPTSWTSADNAARLIRRMQERNAPRRAEVERIVARMRRYSESLGRGTSPARSRPSRYAATTRPADRSAPMGAPARAPLRGASSEAEETAATTTALAELQQQVEDQQAMLEALAVRLDTITSSP